jgi:hypothetical protein
MAPVLAMQAAQGARFTEAEALRQVIADGWEALVPEIKKHLDNTNIARKAAADYPAYVENVVSMVIGQNARKAGLKMDGSKKTFYLEDATSRSTAKESPLSSEYTWVDQKGRSLRGDEQLRKLGIDPEEFAKENIQ